MTNQSDRQQSVRNVTGTSLNYEGDWHALFDQYAIPAGSFNQRMLAYINANLSANYTELNGAMNAMAQANGASSWNSLGNMVVGPSNLSNGTTAAYYYDPMLESTPVGSPIDTIGTVNPAVASGSSRPTMATSQIDGRKVINFAGNQELLSSGLSINPQSFSIVFVTDHFNFAGSGGTGQCILAGIGGGAVRNMYYNYSAASLFDVSVRGGYGGTVNAGMYNIITMVGNASNFILRANGVEVFPSAALTATLISSLRFGRNEALNQSLIGNIAWIGIWNTPLDATQRATEENRIRALLPYRAVNSSQKSFYFIGNSLTEGIGAGGQSTRWGDLAIANSNLTNKLNFFVRSWSGITTAALSSIRAATIDPYMVPTGSGANAFVWELSNSIASGQTGAQAYASLTTYCNSLKSSFPNIKTIAMTMLPRQANATVESERLLVNAAVMTGTTAVPGVPYLYSKGTDGQDFVFDVAGISQLGMPGSQNNATYYLADTTHLTTAGYALIQSAATPIINYLSSL